MTCVATVSCPGYSRITEAAPERVHQYSLFQSWPWFISTQLRHGSSKFSLHFYCTVNNYYYLDYKVFCFEKGSILWLRFNYMQTSVESSRWHFLHSLSFFFIIIILATSLYIFILNYYVEIENSANNVWEGECQGRIVIADVLCSKLNFFKQLQCHSV